MSLNIQINCILKLISDVCDVFPILLTKERRNRQDLKMFVSFFLKILLLIPLYALTYLCASNTSIAAEKEINIRVQQGPFLFLPALTEVPMAQVEIMFRPNKHFNLGVVGNTYNENSRLENSDYILNINNLGMRVDFVLNDDGFTDGIYLSNLLMFGIWNSIEESSEPTACNARYQVSGKNSVTGGSLGYQWFWDNGYNVNIGIAFLESKALDNESKLNSNCQALDLQQKKYTVIKKTWLDLGFGFAF